MKKAVRIACFLLCILLIAACSGGSIVGKWQHENGKIVYEYKEDGTVTVTVEGQAPKSATYTANSETHELVLQLNGLEQSSTYALKGNKLTVTDYNGAVVVFTRIK